MAVRGFPVIVSSPSGGGKTTICGKVLAADELLQRVVTATTRAPRKGEKDGIDYHFWPKARFEKAIEAGLMAEWAKVFLDYYGVPKKSLESVIKRGKNPVLVIDVQGAETVAKHYPDAVKVFILPPSWQVLRERLAGRKDDTRDVAVRVKTAKKEIGEIRKYGYVVINGDLEEATQDLIAIIRAERSKTARQLPRFKQTKTGEYRFI
ncbi:MAG: guanylate kinase [Elusimicrobiaceae bacterium]